MKPLIKFVFIELTNHCNFNCTFCPNAVMTRKRQFMDTDLAIRLLDEIASKNLASEPIQLHLMGEPLLHPQIFEILEFIRKKNLPVRLFTNGALLNEKNRERIYAGDIKELVIGIQTQSDETYRNHRRGKPDFQTYMKNIQDTVEAKFAKNAKT
jgi:MoaA/NifB/PqqE/SkfB family radical SAM enzyme